MAWRAKAGDGGIASDHGLSHIITGSVGIEAAVDGQAVADNGRQPGRVWSGPGSGDAPAMGLDEEAAYGVDGGLTEDDGMATSIAY